MRAVVLSRKGGPEVLEVRHDVPDPVPGPEEVVVDVVATALNRADLLQRRGAYPGPRLLPGFAEPIEIPGLEFAGRVAEVGSHCTEAAPGDMVMGIVGGGAYAERLAIHERQLLRVPAAVGLEDAAAIPEVFLTAWDALVVQGGLTAGRTALVHAGASGVGTAAIQLCVTLGARVIVTASRGKLGACEALGAVAIERSPHPWLAEVLELTGGRGVDVVLDVIGGEELDRNVDALALQGRIVQVGTMGAGVATFALGKLLGKRAAVIGTVLRARPIEEKIALCRRFGREVVPFFADGRLRPVIDARFPLAGIAAAHERMESNVNVGKIVVDVATG